MEKDDNFGWNKQRKEMGEDTMGKITRGAESE